MSELETEMLDEDFSPAEEAYFKSGGEKTDGLLGDIGNPISGTTTGQQTAQPDTSTAVTEAQKATEAAEAARVKDGRMVPFDALHEERGRRKDIEAERDALREKFSRVDERLAVFNQLLAPEAGQQKEEAIDPDKDIFGAFKQLAAKNAALEARIEQTGTKFEQQTAAQQQQAAEQQMMSGYVDEARAFNVKEPNFALAYKHLMDVRGQELRALDPGLTEQQALAIIAREEKEIIANCKAKGTSAVTTIYNLSKLRGFAAHKAAEPVKTDAEKQLEAIQRGKSTSQSLSNVGGVSAEGLTADKVLDMSDDEFADVYSKLSKAAQRKLMGG